MMILAKLSKEFHCARCGIIQDYVDGWVHWVEADHPNLNGIATVVVCDACKKDLTKPSSPAPPSANSPQT